MQVQNVEQQNDDVSFKRKSTTDEKSSKKPRLELPTDPYSPEQIRLFAIVQALAAIGCWHCNGDNDKSKCTCQLSKINANWLIHSTKKALYRYQKIGAISVHDHAKLNNWIVFLESRKLPQLRKIVRTIEKNGKFQQWWSEYLSIF